MKKFVFLFASLTLCFAAISAHSRLESLFDSATKDLHSAYDDVSKGVRSEYDNAVKTAELEKCLHDVYKIDLADMPKIMEKFTYLRGDEYGMVIDSFVTQSKQLNIYGPAPVNPSQGQCSILPVAEYKEVLFENDHLRVSWSVTEAGKQELAQVRPWQSMVVVVQSSEFTSQYADGSTSQETWGVGAYLLPPSLIARACRNVGTTSCEGVVFEIKSSSSCN